MLSLAGRDGLRAESLAMRLGCEIRQVVLKVGGTQPAILGAHGPLAMQIRSAGGRWSASEGAILFPSWSTLEEVLEECVESRRVTLGGELGPG